MDPLTISPELALVDPELRAFGIALLAAEARRPPIVVAVSPAAVPRESGLAVVAGVYLASTVARVLLLDALFIVAVAALVAAVSLFG